MHRYSANAGCLPQIVGEHGILPPPTGDVFCLVWSPGAEHLILNQVRYNFGYQKNRQAVKLW